MKTRILGGSRGIIEDAAGPPPPCPLGAGGKIDPRREESSQSISYHRLSFYPNSHSQPQPTPPIEPTSMLSRDMHH
jgi:hypothetical protein